MCLATKPVKLVRELFLFLSRVLSFIQHKSSHVTANTCLITLSHRVTFQIGSYDPVINRSALIFFLERHNCVTQVWCRLFVLGSGCETRLSIFFLLSRSRIHSCGSHSYRTSQKKLRLDSRDSPSSVGHKLLSTENHHHVECRVPEAEDGLAEARN